MEYYDLVIIGGGPAGLGAAISGRKNGVASILIIERENRLGGILNQCIHNGFGLHYFKEELTGPEYAERFIEKLNGDEIEYKLDTMVIDISNEKVITAVNSKEGIIEITAKTVILAMGCRERPRGAINIPGSRCPGIFTAGTAQKYVNLEGIMPGKNVIILGSGDIGLIMARRITLEGGNVKAVIELMPYSSGLKRNIVQCLDDFEIPLKLSHTITKIVGKDRLEGVIIAKVDENKKPIDNSEEFITCDTLLLSVGLLPENELSKGADVIISSVTGGATVSEMLETSIEGIFACGNVLHVHDLVDNVTKESFIAGLSAAKYLEGLINRERNIDITTKPGIRYTIPNHINPQNIEKNLEVRFRVSEQFKNHYVSLYLGEERILHTKKKILTPGEMETIKINKNLLEGIDNDDKLTISIERE